jgi:hypothetical protein
MPSDKDCLNKPFSHIYIEEKVKNNPKVQEILGNFKSSQLIDINHYKDVFTPSGQNLLLGKHSPSLILAKKEGKLIYEGAPVCENFGNKHFYYTSLIMNCYYDCEYCYLSGMYPSTNIVIFVNIEDIFADLDELLLKHPVYICISYDTDLLALEGFTGFVKEFIEYTLKHKTLTVECRTKSASIGIIKKYIDEGLSIPENFIFAWTLSPSEITDKYEHKTSSFESRLKAVKTASELNLSLRLCFDPIIKVSNWEILYSDMLDKVFNEIPASSLRDISIGGFRTSKDFLSKMRKKRENSVILNYPYILENGVYSYGADENKKLTEFLISRSVKYIDKSKIFTWE